MKWIKTSNYSVCSEDRVFHISRSVVGDEDKYTLWRSPGSQMVAIYSSAEGAKAAAKREASRSVESCGVAAAPVGESV